MTNDPITHHPAADYLASVAASEPVPGGGSVAATVGAFAAALAEMVCQFSVGRHDDPSTNAEIAAVLNRMTAARIRLEHFALEDEIAYATYRAASDLPRSTPEEKDARRHALQNALVGAAEVPLTTAEACAALLPDIEFITTHGNPHVRSDAAIATILAVAAVRASAVNVRVNTGMLKDRDLAVDLESRMEEIESRTSAATSSQADLAESMDR